MGGAGSKCLRSHEIDTTTAFGSLGACIQAHDIEPLTASMTGIWMADGLTSKSFSLFDNEYIVSVSDDGFCKMVRITITDDDGICYLNVEEAGYVHLSDTDCNEESGVTDWLNKLPGGVVAETNSEIGYGISSFRYGKTGKSCRM